MKWDFDDDDRKVTRKMQLETSFLVFKKPHLILGIRRSYACPLFFLNSLQCDRIGRFIGLWAAFQSIWQQLISPNLPHSQAFFVKVSKSVIFVVKSFWATFIDIWRFFTGHTDSLSYLPLQTYLAGHTSWPLFLYLFTSLQQLSVKTCSANKMLRITRLEPRTFGVRSNYSVS